MSGTRPGGHHRRRLCRCGD